MVVLLDVASARWSSGMIRALDCSAYDCARPRFRIPVGPGRYRREVVNFWSIDMHCVHFARSLTFLDIRAQYSTTAGEIRSGPEDRPYNAIAHLLYYSDILYLSGQSLFLSLTFVGFRAISTRLAWFVHRLLGGDQWMDLGQIGIETVTYVRERRCNFG
jgi:hypothetical protein